MWASATHLALVLISKLERLDQAHGFAHTAPHLVIVDLDAANDALRVNDEQTAAPCEHTGE